MSFQKRHGTTALALGLIGLLGLTACDDTNTTGSDTARMSVLLTDAPGDFLYADVTIDEIVLVGEMDELDGEDGEMDGQGRVVLRDTPWSGNLLDLQNEVAELVDDVVVPAGHYQQLRFVISGGCIEVETETGSEVYATSGYEACGDADGQLHMPSYSSSGLKVNLPDGGLELTGDRVVLVDFDVAQSFGHQAGNSGRWVMHPVMHATEVRLSGGIDVQLMLADTVELPAETELADFGVVLDGESPVALLDGAASLEYVLPGTHTLEIVAPEGLSFTSTPELPLEVTLQSDQRLGVEIEITSITEQP